jgi:uncharacterized protein YceH (UPF0502 family)
MKKITGVLFNAEASRAHHDFRPSLKGANNASSNANAKIEQLEKQLANLSSARQGI